MVDNSNIGAHVNVPLRKNWQQCKQNQAGVGIAASSQTKTVVYVDETEAQLNETKSRGITGPGWWSYFTYTDHSGATRHKLSN